MLRSSTLAFLIAIAAAPSCSDLPDVVEPKPGGAAGNSAGAGAAGKAGGGGAAAGKGGQGGSGDDERDAGSDEDAST